MSNEHILKYITKGLRYDGRKMDQFRSVTVEKGVSHSAEGSARVTIGDTVVIAGVKLSLEKPYPDTPGQGNLMINAELTPMSSPDFETGPPSKHAIELSRVIDRSIRESKAIDVVNLCLKEGEQVWSVMVDIVAVNDAGNLFDAAALAATAALQDARYPEITDGATCSIDYNKKTDKKLPLKQTPIEVTIIKIGDQIIADPLSEEEKALDARLTVAVKDNDDICAMQKGGDSPLTLKEIGAMVDLAIVKAKELRKKL